ncbi:MAG: group III truncated hemoglobin [Cyclobacteriaceae bacterium]
MKQQIIQLEDIKLLVDHFYGKVKSDAVLAPIFNERIGDQWPAHMEKMYRFWQTVLLGKHTYLGSPFTPHATLPINETHFTRWLTLFCETMDEHFAGAKADEAKWRAKKMAEMFQLKISYHQQNQSTPLK